MFMLWFFHHDSIGVPKRKIFGSLGAKTRLTWQDQAKERHGGAFRVKKPSRSPWKPSGPCSVSTGFRKSSRHAMPAFPFRTRDLPSMPMKILSTLAGFPEDGKATHRPRGPRIAKPPAAF
jgi:hypothetical protein